MRADFAVSQLEVHGLTAQLSGRCYEHCHGQLRDKCALVDRIGPFHDKEPAVVRDSTDESQSKKLVLEPRKRNEFRGCAAREIPNHLDDKSKKCFVPRTSVRAFVQNSSVNAQ